MMDWIKKRFKYIVLGASCGAVAYYTYLKVTQQSSEDDKKQLPFEEILEKTVDSSLSDSLFKDLSSNESDSFMTDTLTVEGSAIFDPITMEGDHFDENMFEEDGEDNEEPEKKPIKVLLLGLEKSGKSHLLGKLSHNLVENNEYTPTNGYNVVCTSNKDFSISMWEIGGSPLYRAYWRNFSETANLVLFVIDASDQEKFYQAKEYIFEITTELDDSIDFHIVATNTDKSPVSLLELEDILGVKRLNLPLHTIDYNDENGGQELLDCCLAKLSSF